jgi:hypothetical protein
MPIADRYYNIQSIRVSELKKSNKSKKNTPKTKIIKVNKKKVKVTSFLVESLQYGGYANVCYSWSGTSKCVTSKK